MADPHVITALVRKRAELMGQIDDLQISLRQRIIDLDNLDATLRLFDPDMDLEEVKAKPVPPRNAAFRGEVSRIVLTMLRKATAPMKTQDIGKHVMAGRGLNTSDKRLVKLIGKRVGACLRHHKTKGLVESEQGPGQHMVWWVVR